MTVTTQTIEVEQHEKLIDEFKTHPIFPAFEIYIEHLLTVRDMEIKKLYQQINLCLDEINSINLLLKLADKSN